MSANCSQPNGIANGYVLGTQVTYDNGTQVHYVCNSGYTMSGSPTLTCYGSTWYGSYPTCSLSFLWDIWFWLVIALLILLVLVLTVILLFFCIKYICCKSGRRRRLRVDHEDSEDVYGYEDELGIGCCCRCCLPCCLTCCFGCCAFFNCCGWGGCCGRSCPCCFTKPNTEQIYGERRHVKRGWQKSKPKPKLKPNPNTSSGRESSIPVSVVTPTPGDLSGRKFKVVAKSLPVWKPHTHDVRNNNQSTL